MTFKISAITASAAFKSRSFDCVLMFADARAFMDFIAGAGAAAFLAFSNAFMDFDMVMNAKEDDLRNVWSHKLLWKKNQIIIENTKAKPHRNISDCKHQLDGGVSRQYCTGVKTLKPL